MHPILADWPDQPWNCFDLMFMESKCIIGAMVELRYHDLPCYSVHDSIIVPRSGVRKAVQSLTLAFQHLAHATPSLKVSPPSAVDPA